MTRKPGRSIVRSPRTEKLLARRRFLGMLGGGAAALMVKPGFAQESIPPYNRIEEDWELIVGEPDPDTHAPQLINVISPTGDSSGKYGILELNHSTQPEYFEGGLQLQIWSGDECRDYATTTDSSLLNITGETITYTLSMALSYGLLRFRVKNGTSTTWGSFGGSNLYVSTPSTVANLSGYSTAVSVAKSRVAFAGHRVEKFSLKQVRYYIDSDVVKVDETFRQIHPAVE